MPPPALHLGQATLHGAIARYARDFDLLEVSAAAGRLPRARGLRSWREQVPAAFVFSVVVPDTLARLDAVADENELARVLGAAEALRAGWLLVRTPADTTPSGRSRERLAALVGLLRQGAARVGWEPRGLWEPRDAERTGAALGVHVVRDLGRDPAPPGDVVYTRLSGLGSGTRVRGSSLERALDALAGCREAFIVVEGKDARRAAARVRALAAEPTRA